MELTEAKVAQLVNIADRLQLNLYGVQVAGLFAVYVLRPRIVPVEGDKLVGPLTLEEARELNPNASQLVGSAIHEFLLALPGFIGHTSRQQKPE